MRRQPERNANLVDLSQGLGDVGAGGGELRLTLVVVLLTYDILPDQRLCPREFGLRQDQRGAALVERGDPGVQDGNLVVDILNGVLQRPAPAPGFSLDPARSGRGRLQVGHRGVDRRLLL